MPRRAYRHHLVALLGYLGLTLLMTYPLAREFARAIPGDGFDGWQNVWNLWWVKRALLVEGSSPYFTRMVDYPDGVYLYFHTLNIFNGLTFLPFTLNGGPLIAYNAAVLFSFVAGGYGAYLLALYVLGEDRSGGRTWPRGARLAAFLGGAVYTFAPYHMAHLLGHLQLISLEWLPFFALLIIKGIGESGNQEIRKSGNQGSRGAGEQLPCPPAPLPSSATPSLPPCSWSWWPPATGTMRSMPPCWVGCTGYGPSGGGASGWPPR